MSTPPLGPQEPFLGKIVSGAGDMEEGMKSIQTYLDSTYDLQVSDSMLESFISQQETTITQQFQAQLTAPGNASSPFNASGTNFIWQLQNIPSTSDNQQNLGTISTLYSQANAANGAVIKTLDGQSSSAQNILSQNSQAQQSVTQTMGSINSIETNLSHLIQG
ncbi:MAG: hypothetical protein QRY72_01775 [Candidatus Rhabdochlamydia sp.]